MLFPTAVAARQANWHFEMTPRDKSQAVMCVAANHKHQTQERYHRSPRRHHKVKLRFPLAHLRLQFAASVAASVDASRAAFWGSSSARVSGEGPPFELPS